MFKIGTKVKAHILDDLTIEAEITGYNKDLKCYNLRDLEDDCEYIAYAHQLEKL